MMFRLDLNNKKILFRTSDSKINSDRTIMGSSIRIGNTNIPAGTSEDDKISKNLLYILIGGVGAVFLLVLIELIWNRKLIFK